MEIMGNGMSVHQDSGKAWMFIWRKEWKLVMGWLGIVKDSFVALFNSTRRKKKLGVILSKS